MSDSPDNTIDRDATYECPGCHAYRATGSFILDSVIDIDCPRCGQHKASEFVKIPDGERKVDSGLLPKRPQLRITKPDNFSDSWYNVRIGDVFEIREKHVGIPTTYEVDISALREKGEAVVDIGYVPAAHCELL